MLTPKPQLHIMGSSKTGGNTMHRSLSTVLDLKKLDLPPVPKVDAIEWQPIVDHIGDDAYEITVIIPDNTSGPLH